MSTRQIGNCVGISISFLLILFVPPSVRAHSLAANGWGVYVTQTTYRLEKAPTSYELYQTNTGQDIGIFYSRILGRAVSAQIEARVSTRVLDINFDDVSARAKEQFIEFPLIIHGTYIRNIDSSPFRVFVGFGISYSILIQQDIAAFGSSDLPPGIPSTTESGGYQKASWILDGGAVLTFFRRSGIFLSYRMTSDWTTFGDSDDVPLTPEYFSYGFQAGFEWRFGQVAGSPN